MTYRSKSFHLDIQKHGKNPYGLLRNSYREDGKVKKETICRFTGLSLEQLLLMQAGIQGKAIMKDKFKVTSSREYGASYACVSLIKQLGLHKDIFSRPHEEWVRSCLAMVAGRIVYAGSKLRLSHCGSYSALWEVCGVPNEADVNANCYAAMDRLLERQEIIQAKLAAKHLANGTMVLYDITSCYMEGGYEDSELVEFGYNRDRKRGHEQIVISLLCAKDGCPVAVEVLKGNTKDETTVLDKINEIRDKYRIENIVFVGDRGMVTQSKYKEINHELVKVVTALNHGTIQALCDKGTLQLSLFDEKAIVEVIDGNARYCLCKNPVMAAKEAETRRVLIEKTKEELDIIVTCTKKTKYSKEIRAGKVLSKYKMGKFFIFEGSGDDFAYSLNTPQINKESALDGCYVVFTDASADDIAASEIVKNYKSLINVEQAFRNLKTVQLEMRPVYHKRDDRIKCHVFICMLAYYVMWHMNQRLAPLYESDGVGTDRKFTFNYVIETLKSIRSESVEILDAASFIISTPTDEQKQILDLLGVAL
jgi:transposase